MSMLKSSKGSFSFVDVPLSDSHVPGESGAQKGKFYISPRVRLILVAAVTCVLILCLIIGISVVSKQKSDALSEVRKLKNHQHETAATILPPTDSVYKWPRKLGDLTLNENMSFTIHNGSMIKTAWRHSPNDMANLNTKDCSGDSQSNVCLEWENYRKLNISRSHNMLENGTILDCYEIEWTGLRHTFQSLTDCIDTTTAHWYGGYEDTKQYWPLEQNAMPLSPYVSNDAFKNGIGNVLDRYFVSSSGIGILVDNDVPLYFSLNNPQNGTMCFTAKYERYPYFNLNNSFPKLKYKVCNAKDIKDIHLKMSECFIQNPEGIPNEDLFRYPIWSTWAQYHYDINQTTVLQFTNDVMTNNFTCSQIEIDDNWTPLYGDFFFDRKKFPNATDMIKQIQGMRCAVTVWVHPFFNIDGDFFKQANDKHYLLRQVGSNVTALTKWWDGNMTGVLDVSDSGAIDWYLEKLYKLKNETKLDSFKFDAGELSWLPNIYEAANMPSNPCDNYPVKYVDIAMKADPSRRQEVRSGYRTQKYPIFVRQIDKKSAWDHNNAFASVLPGIFTFGILGYPFVLPDMVGGNAYDGRFPDSELFVRWIQLNAFLPSMQLSITPWDKRFNDTDIDVLNISRKFTELHTNVSDVLIKFANMSVQTGEPVIRPLWWIDPSNETALTCEDEFLVGDQYLVAPVMVKGARSRDIYFPSGTWLDRLRGNGTEPVHVGPAWIYNYTIEIDELAYFENMNYIHV